MNFANVKGISIPQGTVSKLSVGGVDVWKSGRLPSGYTEVEYIQSSGNQYIDTGIIENGNEAISAKFQISSANRNYIFGAKQSGNNYAYNSLYNNSIAEYNWEAFSFSAANTIEMTQSISGSVNTIKVNGVAYTKNIGTGSGQSLFIFAIRKNSGEVRYYAGNTKCYYFKINKGGTTVLDLVPCIRKSDSAVGMYDLVSKTFFGNAGTGTFIAGDPV